MLASPTLDVEASVASFGFPTELTLQSLDGSVLELMENPSQSLLGRPLLRHGLDGSGSFDHQ